jgi:phosphopentomutase
MSRRATVVVLDGCGVGDLPDSADYGDAGANTLAHVAEMCGGLHVPVLEDLGLGSILELAGVAPSPRPVVHGRLHPLGPGKDSTTGHWELMGVVAEAAAPTYPRGFPPDVVQSLAEVTGRGLLGNQPCDGLTAIARWGEQHLETGALILYTSQDSVLQLAAHVDVVSEEHLYRACAAARVAMAGEHAVSRVIARPFAGAPGAFARTQGRRDFSLPPPRRSYLDELRDGGVPVHAVGKVASLFAGAGIDETHPGPTNAAALSRTTELLAELESGFVFVNLVETDEVYGHRKDVAGFARALTEVDAAVGHWRSGAREGDMLVLTADHGCDPAQPGSDHTREHAPLLAAFGGCDGRRHDGPLADVGASVLAWLAGREAPDLPGRSFL